MKRASGKPGTRAERAARATELRALGLNFAEIAEVLGISRSYAQSLVNDPSGAHDRARKDSYGGRCVYCGGPTDGSSGRHKAPRRCRFCAAEEQRLDAYWTRSRIIARIWLFAARYGSRPSATDWSPGLARERGHPEKEERYYADGCWPATRTLQERFGSFANAIEAAGFDRPKTGHYVDEGSRSEILGRAKRRRIAA